MPLKRNENAAGSGAAESNGEHNAPFEFRENPRVNAQIDGYIKQNPKRWAFVKSMPRERLERAYVWQQIRSNERQQKMNGGLLRKIEENPALKSAYESLLAQIPEGQRERARVSIARTLVISQNRSQRQNTVAATP
ncbi:MAG: hypothetical protein KGJ88_08430 [Verrucomicrobiota bacterium]|nr:hypothetical protein [Verrucomicrobiota bacterium]